MNTRKNVVLKLAEFVQYPNPPSPSSRHFLLIFIISYFTFGLSINLFTFYSTSLKLLNQSLNLKANNLCDPLQPAVMVL